METIAAPVAEIVAENLFTRVRRHVDYLWKYRDNISELTQQNDKLRDEGVRVQQYVDEAHRQGDDIFPDVEKWLSRAEEMIKETDKFLEDEREAANSGRGCFHLKLRYQYSKRAKNKAGDIVTKILQADNLTRRGVAHRPPPPGIGSSSFSGSQVFKSREATLNQIMEALRDNDISMIGVWGMGGVGKTTLAQQLAERAQVAKQANEEKLFDTVVMALNITQTPDVRKIQGEIASMLGLKFEDEYESERAVRLSQSLKKHKKILVILDDIWEPISFEMIGIPYRSDEHPNGYCKVLLTSREHAVLSKHMGTHKDFHVEHLCEEEAWSLFKENAGDSVEKPEFHPIASEVFKECEGLPIAIVTIAKALKGESVGVWRNALTELRRSAPTSIRGVSKNVYSCLELSYNYLESNEAKSLLLLCGLLGDGDISLTDLLKYGMSLNLFDYMDCLEARDKVAALVTILKASSLLLDVAEDKETYRKPPSSLFIEERGNGYVRMHDVIRDVARNIAWKAPHRFVVKEDVSIQEWEKSGVELRNCTGMSLKCRRGQELPGGLVCPELKLFLLDFDDPSLKIPNTFFEEMKEVRVLSFSAIVLTYQMPSSLRFLSNLRTLSLHGYGNYGQFMSRQIDIAILGELKKLQILSFENCKIGDFPEAMKQLTDLRMLSLRECPAFIPRNLISSLSRLEHLCLRDIYDIWEIERFDSAWFSELKHLSFLRSLDVEIPSSYLLPEDKTFKNLTRYDISIGYPRVEHHDKKTSRRLKLGNVKGEYLVNCFSELLKTAEVLELTNLDYIEHLVNELDGNGFLQLQCLSVFSSDWVQFISCTMEIGKVDPPSNAFPLLEELKLRNLWDLEAVCHGPIPMNCFGNLTVLIIENCPSFKYVLWNPTTQGRESILEFPQLRLLELTILPDIIGFYSTTISESQKPLFIPFFNRQVALPRLDLLSFVLVDNVRKIWHNQYPVGSCSKLKRVKLQRCKNLQTIFPSNFLGGLQSLQILKVDNCRSLKEIFEIDSSVDPPRKESPLHNQNMMSVGNKHLAFQNLNSLTVHGCSSLKYLFPASVVNGLVQLEVLEISDCGVEAIVAYENGLDASPKFLFPRLTSLKLGKLCHVKRFCRGMYTLECPFLKELEVCDCDKVELLFQEKSFQGEVDKQPLFLVDKNTFSNVKELKLSLKGSMEIWEGQFLRESFGNLRNLEISRSYNILVAIPCSKVQAWNNLERLSLRSCKSVKEVISMEGVVEGETFPQLNSMHLEDLPMLAHLFGFGTFGNGLGPVLQNLHHLHISKCGKLINVVSPSMAKRLVQLRQLSITHCSMVEEIVGDDDANDICLSTTELEIKPPVLEHSVDLKSLSSASKCTFKLFPSLEEMKVKKLPRLTHLLYKKILGLDHINLQNIRILEVSGCENLGIVLTVSMMKTLVQLEKLTVGECDKVKEIVLLENEGARGDHQSTNSDEIIFAKLQELRLWKLRNLKSFCSSARYAFRFPCLTDIWLTECPEMEIFCKGDLTTSRFKALWGSSLPRETLWRSSFLRENSLNTIIHKIFVLARSKEEDLEESDCEEVLDEDDDEEGDSEEQHPKVEDSMEEDTKEEDSEEEVLDEDDDEEGDSEEQNPDVEDSMEEDAKEEHSKECLRRRSS